MILVCKAVFLLIIELIIEYIFGTLLTRGITKSKMHPFVNLLTGFFAYQALFQVLSLAVTFSTGVLHHLSMIWSAVVVVLTIIGLIANKGILSAQIAEIGKAVKKYKAVSILGIVTVFVFCYYVSINGETNEDARYYIGLMTTSVGTDSLFRYNVYNGYEVDSLYLRRVLATFEIHSAVLSQISGLHPLITARIFRACQNVILTSAAVFLCGKEIFWKTEERCYEKSVITVVMFWLLQLMFADTIYTPAAFGLYRAYEAKAFTANMLVLFGFYLCMNAGKKSDIRAFVLIGIFLWGSAAISTSAMIVGFAECMVLILGWYLNRVLMKKRGERIHAE